MFATNIFLIYVFNRIQNGINHISCSTFLPVFKMKSLVISPLLIFKTLARIECFYQNYNKEKESASSLHHFMQFKELPELQISIILLSNKCMLTFKETRHYKLIYQSSIQINQSLNQKHSHFGFREITQIIKQHNSMQNFPWFFFFFFSFFFSILYWAENISFLIIELL